MSWRKLRVPGHALTITAALGLAAGMLVVLAPTAVGAQPSCAVSNTRNHKGYSSLQDAVAAAKAGDTLEVKGSCVGNTTLDRDVTLSGVSNKAFPGAPTLDGNQTGRVLTINGGTTTIRNLTITNGLTSGLGGGIYVATAAVLDNVLVTANTAGATQLGGGIEADLGSSLTLIDTTVSDNSAGSSGGIDMFRAKASLTNSTVSGNHATRTPSTTPDGCGFGGPPAVVYACAGGIWNYQGTLALTNSTVSGNSAAYRGGGVTSYVRFFADNTPRSGLTILSGSTSISSNTAGDSGGGIYVNNTISTAGFGVHAADGTATYKDPISGATLPAWTGAVSGNTPDQCSPDLTIGGTSCT
jgi:predicted outer membrane repeat protein